MGNACRAGRPRHTHGGRLLRVRMQTGTMVDLNQTVNVGQYAANPGFFDMHGNTGVDRGQVPGGVSHGNPVVDPNGPASGSNRVKRGGSGTTAGRTCVQLGAATTLASVAAT